MCVVMVFAIESEVREFCIYKDVRSARIDSELPCSPKSAILKTSMPLHTHTPIHWNPHVMLLIFLRELIFVERQLPGTYFQRGKINSLHK